MNTVKRLVPIIFVIFLGACASDSDVDCLSGACDADSNIDCSKTSITDCESEGCTLKTGNIYDDSEFCLKAAQTFGCEDQYYTSNILLIVGTKDGACALFTNELPEGWLEPDPRDCSEFVVAAPLCENAPKCEDLRPSDCLAPRCVVLEGRRFVGPMDGVDSVGCFEAPEPLGCMTANSNCPNNIPATLHEGSCYTFQSGCLPKGWEESSDCPGLNDETCE